MPAGLISSQGSKRKSISLPFLAWVVHLFWRQSPLITCWLSLLLCHSESPLPSFAYSDSVATLGPLDHQGFLHLGGWCISLCPSVKFAPLTVKHHSCTEGQGNPGKHRPAYHNPHVRPLICNSVSSGLHLILHNLWVFTLLNTDPVLWLPIDSVNPIKALFGSLGVVWANSSQAK